MDKIRDTYYTIGELSEGYFKDRGSKFHAYAYPVTCTEEIEEALEEVKAMHPKARHHCYAYRLGIDGEPHRANDDGEPSGTAGKPILGQLKSHKISDALIIVVRYFGGTLLGASGLIQAYKESAHHALKSARKIKKIVSTKYKLAFTYAEMGHVMNIVKNQGLHIVDKKFDMSPEIIISIPRSKEKDKIIELKANLLQISTDEVTMDTKIAFCKFDKI